MQQQVHGCVCHCAVCVFDSTTYHGEAGLVEHGARVEHVAHEGAAGAGHTQRETETETHREKERKRDRERTVQS